MQGTFSSLYRPASSVSSPPMHSLLRTASPYAPTGTDFIPHSAKPGGDAIGTVYQNSITGQLWLGKVGSPLDFFNDSPLSNRSVTVKQINLDSIREKIAADLYCLLGKGHFLTPQTCLSEQDVLDPYTSTHALATAWVAQGVKATLRIMTAWMDNYRDFSKAKIQAGKEVLSFRKCAKITYTILGEMV